MRATQKKTQIGNSARFKPTKSISHALNIYETTTTKTQENERRDLRLSFWNRSRSKKRRSSKQANLFSFVFSFSLFLYLFPELVAFEHWFMNSQKQSSGKIYQQMAENSVLQQHFHYGQRYGRQSRDRRQNSGKRAREINCQIIWMCSEALKQRQEIEKEEETKINSSVSNKKRERGKKLKYCQSRIDSIEPSESKNSAKEEEEQVTPRSKLKKSAFLLDSLTECLKDKRGPWQLACVCVWFFFRKRKKARYKIPRHKIPEHFLINKKNCYLNLTEDWQKKLKTANGFPSSSSNLARY